LIVQKGYQDCLHDVHRFINEGDIGFWVVTPDVRVLRQALDIIERDCNAAARGRKIEAIDDDKATVTQALRALVPSLVIQKRSDALRQFTADFASLCSNWNTTAARSRWIEETVEACLSLLDADQTLAGLLDLSRELLKMTKNLQYAPPGEDLSKHYLKNIREALEKEGPRKCSD
jgi:hypothetical protein